MAASNNGPHVFQLGTDARAFTRLPINKADDETRAVLSKLVTNRPDSQPTPQQRKVSVPSEASLARISDNTAESITDSESIMQMLPDTALAEEMLVSSILSPKDMMSMDLIYSVETGSMETELVQPMLQVIEEFFDKGYKIKKILQPCLKDALFRTGSYPLLVLPENSIDEAINSPTRVTMECLLNEFDAQNNPYPVGFLGAGVPAATAATAPTATVSTTRLGFESLVGSFTSPVATAYAGAMRFPGKDKVDPMIDVTDNLSLLKLPFLREKAQQDRVTDLLSVRHTTSRNAHLSMEARGNKAKMLTTGEVEASLYKKRRYKTTPVLSITPSELLKTDAVGHPLVLKLPSECVIPVHVPGNPAEHVGYFVLLDEMGNPLTKAQMADHYTDMTANVNSMKDMTSQLLTATRRSESGVEQREDPTHKELINAYGELIEEDLLHRLRTGIYGNSVKISKNTEVYRVMLARALAKQRTRILYVPVELMTYVAFDHNRYGVGRSLLEKNRILGSIRSIMLFANTMSAIKNSIAREELNITLDAKDKDPTGTVEFLVHEYSKGRQSVFPVGASNPLDIISFMQNAGISVNVSGNSGYPDTKMTVEDKGSAKIQPNTELMKDLQDQYLMGIGIPPETVKAGANIEFATTLVTQNLLMARRVKGLQDQLTDQIVDHLQKYTIYSGHLMNSLRKVVKNAKATLAEAKTKAAEQAKLDKQAQVDALAAAKDEQAKDDDKSLAPPEAPKPEAHNAAHNPGATILTDKKNVEEDQYGDDAIIYEFIRSLRVSLPSPDTARVEQQLAAFDKYTEFVEKGIKAYIDKEFLTNETMGDLAPTIEATVAVVRAYYQRRWLRTNNVLPELTALTHLGSEDEPFDLLDIQEGHVGGIMKSVGGFMKKLKARMLLQGVKEAPASTFGGGDTSGGMGGGGGFGDLDSDLAGGGLDTGGGDTGTDSTGTGEETPPADQPTGDEPAPDAKPDDGDKTFGV